MKLRVGFSLLGAVALVMVSVGPSGQVASPSLSKDIQPIFDQNCTGCHGAKRQRAGLNLSPEKAYGALVNRASTQVETLMLVKPGDADASYLVQKLEHRSAQGKGMPKGIFGSGSLKDEEIQAVRAWISGGAKP